jgi:hypothetical protein
MVLVTAAGEVLPCDDAARDARRARRAPVIAPDLRERQH